MASQGDVDLEALEGVTLLGETPPADAAAITKAVSATEQQNGKVLWTWERLPYSIRCAGLTANAAEEDSSSEENSRRERGTVCGGRR